MCFWCHYRLQEWLCWHLKVLSLACGSVNVGILKNSLRNRFLGITFWNSGLIGPGKTRFHLASLFPFAHYILAPEALLLSLGHWSRFCPNFLYRKPWCCTNGSDSSLHYRVHWNLFPFPYLYFPSSAVKKLASVFLNIFTFLLNPPNCTQAPCSPHLHPHLESWLPHAQPLLDCLPNSLQPCSGGFFFWLAWKKEGNNLIS